MKLLISILTISMCLLPGPAAAQGLKDIFNSVKKAIDQKVDERIVEKVENPCIDKEGNAQVDSPDFAKTGTWIIETTDGRRFQVSEFAIAGALEDGTNVATFLSMAESASFSQIDHDRLTKTYRVHIEYTPVAENGTGARGILGAIANNVARSNMKNDFSFVNSSVGGSSLDGKEWCLNIPTNSLRSIRLMK